MYRYLLYILLFYYIDIIKNILNYIGFCDMDIFIALFDFIEIF